MSNIRAISTEDLMTIIDEYIDYFNVFEGMNWTDETVRKRLLQLVNRLDYVGLGFFKDRQLIGFVVGNLLQFDDGIIAILNEIFIIHSEQNKKYGTMLLKAFEKEVKAQGAFRIQLETADDSNHHRFYNKQNQYRDAKNNILKSKSL